MRFLADTHVMIWWFVGSLPPDIKALMQTAPRQIAFSVVTPWEIAIKHAKGKLPLGALLQEKLRESEFSCLPIALRHIEALSSLPKLHGDPFDRMLVAQAASESLTLITADKHLAEYSIKVRMVGF